MSPRASGLIVRWAAVAACLALLVALLRREHGPAPWAAAGPPSAARSSPGPGSAGADRSELTDRIGAPDGDIRADLRILNALFAAYRGATHGGNPVGENREITAALRGKNRLGYAFVPEDCPALNARGELCDRWGTPFFFHQLSGERMEVRSAGPDRRLWTADDVVMTP
jgi:hypothetical protein